MIVCFQMFLCLLPWYTFELKLLQDGFGGDTLAAEGGNHGFYVVVIIEQKGGFEFFD